MTRRKHSAKALREQFDVVAVATDVVVFTVQDDALKVLLIKLTKDPFTGRWACPGGLVEVDESIDNAAQRHLQQKTGLEHVHLEQLYTFGDINRDPFGRVVSTAYMALLPAKNVDLKTTEAYADIGWFDVNALPAMAYDHDDVVALATERLRSKLSYTNIAYGLLPKAFTMRELQDVYEVILGRKLDKRNFQRKLRSLGLVKKTGKKRRGEPHRPASLYAFASRKPQIVEIL